MLSKQQEGLADSGNLEASMALLQVGSIIFLAEWGDRSMLATVALGASHSPLGKLQIPRNSSHASGACLL